MNSRQRVHAVEDRHLAPGPLLVVVQRLQSQHHLLGFILLALAQKQQGLIAGGVFGPKPLVLALAVVRYQR